MPRTGELRIVRRRRGSGGSSRSRRRGAPRCGSSVERTPRAGCSVRSKVAETVIKVDAGPLVDEHVSSTAEWRTPTSSPIESETLAERRHFLTGQDRRVECLGGLRPHPVDDRDTGMSEHTISGYCVCARRPPSRARRSSSVPTRNRPARHPSVADCQSSYRNPSFMVTWYCCTSLEWPR